MQYRMRVGRDRVMIYQYGTDEWACRWNNFCEIGAPYQAWFRHQMALLTIVTEDGVDANDNPVDLFVGIDVIQPDAQNVEDSDAISSR